MQVELTGGFYQAKNLVAGAQRCLNLFPETNQKDSPFPVTHYLTPGLLLLAEDGDNTIWRCLYRSTSGNLFGVIDDEIVYIESDGTRNLLGTLASGTTPVSMMDNGLALIIVDGTSDGYAVDLASLDFAPIVGAGAFYGSDRVDFTDTYFLFNRPSTNQWYISLSEVTFDNLTGGPVVSGSVTDPGSAYTNGGYPNVAADNSSASGDGATFDITVAGGVVTVATVVDPGFNYRIGDVLSVVPGLIGGTGSGFQWTVTETGSSAFDPLDISAKIGYADPIASVIALQRNVWLIGELTGEAWNNTGAADFTFQAIPGVFIEHGCVAKYSICKADVNVFWLSQDLQGQAIVLQGTQLSARRISTHAIENELGKYETISDAQGFTYQQEGHVFYVLIFPSADKTWVYDLATELWHERCWIDVNGAEHRIRPNCAAFCYGQVIVGDWQNGNLYTWDLNELTDNGDPIVRRRGFPHMLNDGKRVLYRQFIAALATGAIVDTPVDEEPSVSLRWSDTGGFSWGDPIQLGLGASGQYIRQAQAQRLGYARDRVFELFWSTEAVTALNGAFVDVTSAGT
jgi:hypothetical protein